MSFQRQSWQLALLEFLISNPANRMAVANNRTIKHIPNKVYALYNPGLLFLKYFLTFSFLEISDDSIDSCILDGSFCLYIV